MTKRDIKQGTLLGLLIVGLVVSLTTGWLAAIIVPLGLTVFAVLAFGAAYYTVFHLRRYSENHPYIPYVGKLAHVLCKECNRSDFDSRIEVEVGTAFEGWTKAGRYFRGFRRTYTATCERGHKWTYDPILERNEITRARRAPLTPEQKARARARRAERSRALREGFHRMIFAVPKPTSDS